VAWKKEVEGLLEEGPTFDRVLLASAEIWAGAREGRFQKYARTCPQAGRWAAMGTGPAFFNGGVVGRTMQSELTFRVSPARWTESGSYGPLTTFRISGKPARLCAGTSMAFAGLASDAMSGLHVSDCYLTASTT